MGDHKVAKQASADGGQEHVDRGQSTGAAAGVTSVFTLMTALHFCLCFFITSTR